jgi:large subunit ribosomal protein L2
MVDFKRNKDGIPAKVERIEYDPNRSAHLALLCYADGERRYIIAPRGVEAGAVLMSGPRRRSSRATACRCATSRSVQHDPLHRDDARQGRADRTLRRHLVCSCWRAKAATLSCVCVPVKFARCMSTAAPRSAKSATKSTACARSARPVPMRWRGIRPTVRGVAMNPVDHPHGGGEGRTGEGRVPVSPWGQPTKGYRTRNNKRTTT